MGFSLIKPGVLFAGLFVCGWPPGQFTTGTNPHSPRTQKKKPSSPRLLPSPSPSLLSVHSSLPLLAHTPGGPPGISAIKCKEGNNSITKGGLHTQGRRHLLLGGLGARFCRLARDPGGWSGPSRGLVKELFAIDPWVLFMSDFLCSSSRSLRLWPWHRSQYFFFKKAYERNIIQTGRATLSACER